MKRKQLLTLGVAVFFITAALTMNGMGSGGNGKIQLTEADVGKMCLSGALMIGSRGTDRQSAPNDLQVEGENGTEVVQPETTTPSGEVVNPEGEGEPKDQTQPVVDTQDVENPTPQTMNIDSSKPLVIIYHTHATESYQPASEGNFHVLEEASTVREVGNILTAELEKQGIQVVHDKTIHDNPSYNQSYSRSLETINSLLDKYKNAAVVIDLHRDAAGYSGGSGKTAIVNGETVAKYNLVVGNGNPNADKLKVFANTVNRKAEEMFPGYGGRIIEKDYKFNQYVSDYHLLLEVGNNENNIRESKASAKYFADVLASVIKDCSN
ncbi:MAG: stage II sporulation protein P [Aminipila sp.]